MKENTPKRHCMVVYARYPIGETRVQREAEALIKQGYEVDVICLRTSREPAVDEHQGVRIYREAYRFPIRLFKGGIKQKFLDYMRFFVSAFHRLNKLNRKNPYGTVQVHNLPDFLVFCTFLIKLRGVRVILDLHDLMPEFYGGRFGKDSSTWLGRMIRWQEKVSCRFADHVITVSEHWRQSLIKRGVPPEKCSVVMNVADDRIFHLPPDGADHRSFDEPRLHMIYHGTLVQRYGLDLAVQAVDKVRQDLPNVHLTLLGAGDDHVRKLIQMAQDPELGPHVTIYNEVRPAEELPDIILQSDIGIVPYRNDVFTDGLLPTKLMEYGALGLPAIAARTTAIERYFGDTMVEFFEPGDVDDLARCIRKLYGNVERLKELSEGTQRFNQRYNWPKISAEYTALVARLQAHE